MTDPNIDGIVERAMGWVGGGNAMERILRQTLADYDTLMRRRIRDECLQQTEAITHEAYVAQGMVLQERNKRMAELDERLLKMTEERERATRIYTRCPACHHDTLTINKGHLLCTWIDCKDPTFIDSEDLGKITEKNLTLNVALAEKNTALKAMTEQNTIEVEGWKRAAFAAEDARDMAIKERDALLVEAEGLAVALEDEMDYSIQPQDTSETALARWRAAHPKT